MQRFTSFFRATVCAFLTMGTLVAPLYVPSPAPAAPRVSVLAPVPDWGSLEAFQSTITREEFLRLLNTVYAPDGVWRSCIEVGPDSARIFQPGSGETNFRLRFASPASPARPSPRYWKTPGSLVTPAGRPLAGYTIALDPGHIGGRWARMEERWFVIGNSKPVQEGDMAFLTARYLAERLAAMGAEVLWVRPSAGEPVTGLRPGGLRGLAREELARAGVKNPRRNYNGPADPYKSATVQWQSELLFYRIGEIRARAEKVNNTLHPDLVICLHYNAEEWGDPANPQLTDKNHLHLLVNGNYHTGELRAPDVRYELIRKLLSRSAGVEIALSGRVAASLARATGLPPYEYHGGKAHPAGSPYVWTRNLLASRLYRCPVVYCEPYVMNNAEVFERVQMGDYSGTRSINGVARRSIFQEYAGAVADGVRGYFEERVK